MSQFCLMRCLFLFFIAFSNINAARIKHAHPCVVVVVPLVVQSKLLPEPTHEHVINMNKLGYSTHEDYYAKPVSRIEILHNCFYALKNNCGSFFFKLKTE